MIKPKWPSFRSAVAGLFCIILSAAPLETRGAEFAIRTDVMPSSRPREVQLVEHDFLPGESSDWHVHPGAELACVVAGTFELRVAGEKPRRVIAGDTFQIARETPHELRNVGKTAGRVIISYLMDKGALEGPGSGTHRPFGRPAAERVKDVDLVGADRSDVTPK